MLLMEVAVTFVNSIDTNNVTAAQVILMHNNAFMDPTFDCLSDHQVEADDEIQIFVTRKLGAHNSLSYARCVKRTRFPSSNEREFNC